MCVCTAVWWAFNIKSAKHFNFLTELMGNKNSKKSETFININGKYKGNNQSYLLLNGYIKILSIKNIPNDVCKIILDYYGNILLFNVYNKNGNNIASQYNGIYISGDSLYLINNVNKLDGPFGSNNYFNFDNCFGNETVMFMSQGCDSTHYFIKTANTLYTKGRNNNCQCGMQTNEYFVDIPVSIEYTFDSKLIQIKTGANHSLFLTENGNVYGCGNNDYGQLTDKYFKNNNSNYTIQCIIVTNDIKYIDCSINSSYILDDYGVLKSFGNNKSGELGVFSFEYQSFKPLFVLANVIQMSCGLLYFGCITSNNEASMFQYNKCNKIIIKNSKIISVKCGGHHTILKTQKNKYYGFGKCTDNLLIIDVKKHLRRSVKPILIPNEYMYKLTKSNAIILDVLPTLNDTYIIQQI